MKLKDLYESLKGKPIDEISKGILNALERIKVTIRGSSILRYVSKGYDKEVMPIFVVFDTETTGLNHGIKEDKATKTTYVDYNVVKQRDVIYELAAIAYDNDFRPIEFSEKTRQGDLPKEGGFHGKLQQSGMKYKNPDMFLNRLKVTGFDMGNMAYAQQVFKKYKKGFNVDEDAFAKEIKDAFNLDINSAKNVTKLLSSYFKLKAGMELTKYEKDDFKGPVTDEKYKIHRYEDEFRLVKHFIEFAEHFKSQGTVYIVAQNLKYDAGMVESCLHYFIQHGSNDEKSQAEDYLRRFEDLLSHRFDTQSLFRKVMNFNKVLSEIESYFPTHGVAIIDKIEKMNPVAKNNFGKTQRSISLGKLAPKSLNKVWHTAMNDVYVTIETLRYYTSLVKLLSQIKRVIGGKKSKYIIDEELIRYLQSSQHYE